MLSPQLIILNHQSLKQKYWPGFSNVTHRSPIGSTQEGSDILNMYDIMKYGAVRKLCPSLLPQCFLVTRWFEFAVLWIGA